MYDSSFFTLRYRYRELLSSFLSTSVPSTNDRYALIWNCKRSNTYCIRKKGILKTPLDNKRLPRNFKQIHKLILICFHLFRLLKTFSYSALNIAGSRYCYRWSSFHLKAKSNPGIFTPTHLESTFKKLCICYRSNLISVKVLFNLGWFSIYFVF